MRRFGRFRARLLAKARLVDRLHVVFLPNRASDMIATSKRQTLQRAGFASTLLTVVFLLLPLFALAQAGGAPKRRPRRQPLSPAASAGRHRFPATASVASAARSWRKETLDHLALGPPYLPVQCRWLASAQA